MFSLSLSLFETQTFILLIVRLFFMNCVILFYFLFYSLAACKPFGLWQRSI